MMIYTLILLVGLAGGFVFGYSFACLRTLPAVLKEKIAPLDDKIFHLGEALTVWRSEYHHKCDELKELQKQLSAAGQTAAGGSVVPPRDSSPAASAEYSPPLVNGTLVPSSVRLPMPPGTKPPRYKQI